MNKNEVFAEVLEEQIKSKKTWGCLTGSWVAQTVRDAVVRFVRYWATRAEMLWQRLLKWGGIPTSKFYTWEERLGKANQHNAKLPRHHWLRCWERQAVLDYQAEHPEVGYRQLTYMMLDAEVVAASPSIVYRALKNNNRMGQRAAMSRRKGEGFDRPAQAHAHWHIDVSYLNISGTLYSAVLEPG